MLSSRATRRFLAYLGALAAPALLAAACNIDVGVGGNDPPCQSHADCAPGELCLVDGTCSAACPQNPEVCDGIDNDGDGVVDEVCNGLCMTDAECPPGQQCVNGMCYPGQCIPSPEICDMIDNDCNGLIDDNCNQPCDPATGNCPPCMVDADCPAGHQCVNGVCQSGQCIPSPEVCDMIDNDCDGVIDDNCNQPCDPNGNCPPCMVDADCPAGHQCVNGVCQSGQCIPSPEVCDMVDNDCNGVIDDNCSFACNADGTCPPGYQCVNGVCYAGPCMPSPEVCDGIDNDCNGAVDENCQACMVDADCPAGHVCDANYFCVPGMP